MRPLVISFGLLVCACQETAEPDQGQTSNAVCGPSGIWCYNIVAPGKIDSATIATDDSGVSIRLGAAGEWPACSDAVTEGGLLFRWQRWPAVGTYSIGDAATAVLTNEDGTKLTATTGEIRIEADIDVCVSGTYRLEFGGGAMAEGQFAALACD